MWQRIREKINELKAFDSTYQVFGAESHQYHLNRLISEQEMKAFEESIGVELPAELRSFYMEMGNGVVGPDFGLLSLYNLYSFQPTQEYPGYLYFKQLAADGDEEEMKDDYFELNHDRIFGLLAIIEVGCGHCTCIATLGPRKGMISEVGNAGGISDTDQTFKEFYEAWLDKWINAFRLTQELINSNLSAQQIGDEVYSSMRVSGKNLMCSLIKAEKPAELFGSNGHKKYGGMDQFHWYEKVLKEYREKHL